MWLCCQIVATRGVSSSKTVCFQPLPGFAKLFVLDRGGRLRRTVEENAVYSLDLMRNAVGQAVEKLPVEMLNGRRHCVARIYGTDDDRPRIRTLSVGDSGRGEIGNDGEILPNLARKTSLRKLLAEDRVGFANSFQTVTRDGADTTNKSPCGFAFLLAWVRPPRGGFL